MTLDHGAAPDGGAPDPSSVLVVLPALDEEAHIEACLRSLMDPADWMAGTTVVVADGGSKDRTREIVRRLRHEFPNLSLVPNPGRLQSAGMNAAVAAVATERHEILVRCDVHALYPPGYVRAVATTLHETGVASVVTVMDAVGRGAVQRAAAWVVDTPLGSGGAAHRGGRRSGLVDHGHHAGFDLAWFRRLGGYDPSFSHNEDNEYDLRLAEAGGRIWLAAGIRLRYLMRPTLPALGRQYWNYGRGRARTIAKHRSRPRLRQLVPVANLALLGLSLAMGLAWWPPALIWVALYLGLLVATSLLGALRLRSADGLLAGPVLAAIHLGWASGFARQIVAEARRRPPGRPARAGAR